MGRISYLEQIPFGSDAYKAASEQLHQFALLEWLRKNRPVKASLIFAIPNGGTRNKIEAAKMKIEGVRAGVPDLLLPLPMHGYAGLFIEMKSMADGTRPSEDQIEYINRLRGAGYMAFVAHGWAQAVDLCYIYENNYDYKSMPEKLTSGLDLNAQLRGEYGVKSWRPL